jgi:hypothetical protein
MDRHSTAAGQLVRIRAPLLIVYQVSLPQQIVSIQLIVLLLLEQCCLGGQMKLARIVAPFGLSVVLFILAYLSSKDTASGYFPLMLMGIGIVLAIVGVAAIFSNK